MAIEISRLVSIIEYAQQSARMKASAVASVTSHGLFTLWESDAQGRPGILANPDATAEDDERWLVVQRLQQTSPPAIKSAILTPWVEVTQAPYTAPKLKQFVFGRDLVAAGTHRVVDQKLSLTEERTRLPEVTPEAIVNLGKH